MLRLIIVHQNQRLAVDLKDGVYRIGRQKPADIVVPDTTVSSNHAELQVMGDECLIRDLDSRNGTFVNGKQIRVATKMNPGDDVRIGAVPLSVELPHVEAKPARPLAQAPAGAAGPTAKLEAVKVVSSKLRWPLKYWIAGAEAILLLLLLFFVVLIYSESAASQVRQASHYKALASQYLHVLQDPEATVVPPPVTDESLKPPFMVANRQGEIVYPPPVEGVRQNSPLIDPATKKVRTSVRWGLAALPSKPDEGPLKSYPVSVGGQNVGYVIAGAAGDSQSSLGKNLALVVVSGLIVLIVLYFLLAPVNHLVRSQIDALRVKISPLFNGFTDELPRSGSVPELNEIASEIEKSFVARKSESDRAGGRATARLRSSEFAPLLGELLDSAKIPYCFVNSDFKILTISPSMRKIEEFGRATVDTSIFDTGLTAIQSKQLVHAMTEAKKGGEARVRLPFTLGKGTVDHDVSVRLFSDPAKGQLYGLILHIPEA